jgi:MFS transporter, DHA1 family, tetracycline resistance protein
MKRKPSLLLIFLSVFIDLIGFGIVLPLLPGYVEDFGAKGFMIGVIIASYSAMQFLFAPAWGKLSDRIGRRPVMLISNAGAAGSYVLFAVASTQTHAAALWLILASRVFAGICGANLSVASAYIADISPPEKRSQRMGLIGMAFGLGFIFGPALGSFSAGAFGKGGPGWFAAGFCAFNFILGWFVLGESKQPSSAPVAPRPKFAQWAHTLSHPKLGLLIGIFFLATFCFACFESTFPLLVKHRFNMGERDHRVGYLFTYAGVIAAGIQGGLIGRLVKRFGEQRLIFGSLLVVALSLALLPFHTSFAGLLFSLGLFAAGSGVNRPPVFGLISLNAPPEEQGATLGVAQSAGSLARILGPIFATSFYSIRPSLPYLICAGVAFVAALLAWRFLCTPGRTAPAVG